MASDPVTAEEVAHGVLGHADAVGAPRHRVHGRLGAGLTRADPIVVAGIEEECSSTAAFSLAGLTVGKAERVASPSLIDPRRQSAAPDG